MSNIKIAKMTPTQEEEYFAKLYKKVWAAANAQGTSMGNGCLPVSLLALERLQSDFPEAKVVIGTVAFKRKASLAEEQEIKAFISNPEFDAPGFHAWIDLGNGKMADFTLGQTCHQRLPQFQQAVITEVDAAANELIYVQVLKTNRDVKAFETAVANGKKPRLGCPIVFSNTLQSNDKPGCIAKVIAKISTWFRK